MDHDGRGSLLLTYEDDDVRVGFKYICNVTVAWTIALLEKPAGKNPRHGQNLEYTRPYTFGLSPGEGSSDKKCPAWHGASIGVRIGVDRRTVSPGV